MTLQIAGTLRDSGSSPRSGADIIYLVFHHGATTSRAALFATLEGTSREVSCSYAVGGGIWQQVPEHRRPWTSGAASIDDVAITVETLNSTGAPSWLISDADYASLAAIAFHVHTEYGVPLARSHIFGHNEILPRFGVGYATACPGGMDIDRIIREAKVLKALATNTGEDDMPYIMKDPEGYWLISGAGRAFIHKSATSPQVKQARAALAAWRKAAQAGKAEFSLGKWNGRKLRELLASIGK